MNVVGRGFLVAIAACLPMIAFPLAVSADTSSANAVVTLAEPGIACVGDAATLSWAAPADASGLIGYEIEQLNLWGFPNPRTTFVAPDQTSLAVTLLLGPNAFFVRSVTPNSEPTLVATADAFAGGAPRPMEWELGSRENSVGDSTATVTFKWFGPVTSFTTGGMANTVRVTASPGGAAVELPADNEYVIATFAGLTNGVGYTFTAVTFNACGSRSSFRSAVFTPGVAPVWTRNTPPLTVSAGEQYVYQFAADGDPPPSYRLVAAPSWLTISPQGLLSGRPPAGTESFSFSVAASNGVGIPDDLVYGNTDIVAGPFQVIVKYLPTPIPTTKDQCKDDGWTRLADSDGRPFKSQGDCVSFVNAKGKTTARAK